MLKNKVSAPLLAGAMALVGMMAGAALIVSAESASTSANTPVAATNSPSPAKSTADKPESANDPADTDTGSQAHRHAPLGGDGVVSSITGTTIVVGEESDEGGASYTVDASKATVTNNGASASLSDITVGEKIFVQGAVNGTSVTATSISLGHPNGSGRKEADDNDGSAGSEANEKNSSSDASDQ